MVSSKGLEKRLAKKLEAYLDGLIYPSDDPGKESAVNCPAESVTGRSSLTRAEVCHLLKNLKKTSAWRFSLQYIKTGCNFLEYFDFFLETTAYAKDCTPLNRVMFWSILTNFEATNFS